jgi:hypothetical protein
MLVKVIHARCITYSPKFTRRRFIVYRITPPQSRYCPALQCVHAHCGFMASLPENPVNQAWTRRQIPVASG